MRERRDNRRDDRPYKDDRRNRSPHRDSRDRSRSRSPQHRRNRDDDYHRDRRRNRSRTPPRRSPPRRDNHYRDDYIPERNRDRGYGKVVEEKRVERKRSPTPPPVVEEQPVQKEIEEEQPDMAMMKLMGFGGFGTTKNQHVKDDKCHLSGAKVKVQRKHRIVMNKRVAPSMSRPHEENE